MARVQARYQSPPMQQPEKGLMQTVGESIGSNVVGNVGSQGAKMAMNKLGSMLAPTVAGPGLAGSAAAGQGVITGAGAAGAGSMAALASNPLGWAVLGGLALRQLFRNKGGAVGPLSPQYKANGGEAKPMYAGEGAYTFPIGPSDPRLQPQSWDDFQWYKEAQRLGRYGDTPFDADDIFDDVEVGYKKHGGMTGPLSNNKSVKMEKKETIEYKN